MIWPFDSDYPEPRKGNAAASSPMSLLSAVAGVLPDPFIVMDRDGSNPRLLAEDAIVPTWGRETPADPVLDERLYLPMMTR